MTLTTAINIEDVPEEHFIMCDRTTGSTWTVEDVGFMLGLNRPVNGKYLVVLDYDVQHGAELPEIDPDHLAVYTPSGGVHVYYYTNREYAGRQNIKGIDVLTYRDRFPVDESEIWPIKSETIPYERKGEWIPELPAEWEALLSEPREHADAADMPDPVKPTPVEAEMLISPNLAEADWTADGGRNTALFSAVLFAFKRAKGSPERRMGKALHIIEPYLDEAYRHSDDHKAEQRYSSLEAFWRFNKGLGSELAQAQAEPQEPKPEKKVPMARGKLPVVEEENYQPGGLLIQGRICMVVAPKGVGKTTFTFGYLVPGAVRSGMNLIVFSQETESPSIAGYAVAHGYEDSSMGFYRKSKFPDPQDEEVRRYVMDEDGAFNKMKAAIEIHGGTPSVIVMENPETYFTKRDVDFIGGDSDNPTPTSYKAFLDKVQDELLAPGGHSMIWITHTSQNVKDGGARGGRAAEERARQYYNLSGSTDDVVTLLNKSNSNDGITPLTSVIRVRDTTMEERQAAAKMSGVKITDHRIPKKVFDELEALSAVADEVGNFEHITEGTFKSVEVLEMFDIPGDKHNAARKVRQLKMPLLKRGYTIEQSGHSWVITEIQKEETK